MKKLNKLQINPEKLMKNEELISLRGGTNCLCQNENGSWCMTGTAPDFQVCEAMCIAAQCDGQVIFTGY